MSTEGSKVLMAVVAMVALGALAVTASAASLGGISVADLFAWSSPVTVATPSPVALDQFACTGNLDGKTDDYGNVWTEHAGNWLCVGSTEVKTRQPVTLAYATVDIGVSDDVYLTALVSKVSTQPNRSGPGVVFLSDGLVHMFVIYERDLGQITLGKFDGIRTTLASTPISDRPAANIRVEIGQPDITVTVDGAVTLTYTMNALETAIFGGNTRFGMELDNDNQSRFDWFLAEAL